MKTTPKALVALMLTLALLGCDQRPEVAYPSRGVHRHPFAIASTYDKFDDATRLSLVFDITGVDEHGTQYVGELDLSASYPGTVVHSKLRHLTIGVRWVGRTPLVSKSDRMAWMTTGGPVSWPSNHDDILVFVVGDVASWSARLDSDTFVRHLDGATGELRVSRAVVRLGPHHLEAMRDFASRLVPPAN